MNIVVLTRYFESVPESDVIIADLDLCSTPEELVFKSEIENCLSNRNEYLENPSNETLDILSGRNSMSFSKINFSSGPNWNKPTPVNGTICYGPIVCM